MNQKIAYTFEKSLIERQYIAEQAFMDEFKRGKYTLEQPLIKLDPYEVNPLAALILFRTEKTSAVTVLVHGIEEAGNIEHTFPKAKEHIVPVLGLYPNHKNKIDLILYEGKQVRIEIETGSLKDAPVLQYMHTTDTYMKDDLIFVTPSLAALATAFDYRGDIRWHLSVPVIFDMKRLKNGNILIGTQRVLHLPYHMSGLYEMSLTGKIIREYCIPGGYHHDQWEMEDGNLLVLSNHPSYETVEDVIVLLDRKTGNILKTWDLKNCLTPGEGPSGGYTSKDWFHNNAMWYDKHTNALILSGRHTDSIISIDYDTGKLNWILGDDTSWSHEKQKYFFKPVGDKEFDWQYEQHGCLVAPNGDIMCFDNGHYRSKIRAEYRQNKDNFSRGVRYRLNTDEMTIKQVWQYGKERGEAFFSSYIGNVEYYKDGHYMIHSGGIQYYGEHASETPAAILQNDEHVRSESITIEMLNDKIMMELKISGNFYRAKKMKLYHEFDNLLLGKGIRLGKMGKTPEFNTHIPIQVSDEYLPKRYQAKLIEEDDRITLKAIFEQGQLVMLILENELEEHSYFVSTAKNKFNALCCGTFIDKDARSITISVNMEGLHGIFDVYIIVDEKKYRSGVRITC